MEFKEIFGIRLKKLRQSLNMSQEVFAEKVGLSRNTISRAETGTTSLTAENLAKIRNSIKIDLNRLFNLDDNNSIDTIEQIKIKLRTLNEESLYEVNKFIDTILKEKAGE